ncbi:MAG: HAD hydrolase-like protein [Acetobacter papayae]
MTVRRLAVFDMDGTLLDSLPDLAESCRELLAFYGLPALSDTMIRTMIGRGGAGFQSTGGCQKSGGRAGTSCG